MAESFIILPQTGTEFAKTAITLLHLLTLSMQYMARKSREIDSNHNACSVESTKTDEVGFLVNNVLILMCKEDM